MRVFTFILTADQDRFRMYKEHRLQFIFTNRTLFNETELTLTPFCNTEESIPINPYGFSTILGLQPRYKAAMLVVNTKETLLLNLHPNRVHFPAERNAFVLDHQHGRRDVTCKPCKQ